MKQGAMMTAVGMGCGIVGAFLFTRLMTHVLYQVRATDPVTYVGVTVMLGAVALAACYIPAKRATRIDPAETLRHE
jgi:putative ABC transport system permease protein